MKKNKIFENNIKTLYKEKGILLISHAVLGFPSFDLCRKSILEMVTVGVDIIELQIPFSEPQADGPFFTEANHLSLKNGTTVKQCLKFSEEIVQEYDNTNFVFMTYYNILFKYGVEKFIKRAYEIGIKGIIVPDLPIEEGSEYINACSYYGITPIFMFTPTTTDERMKFISQYAEGFIYCQSRTGVTGKHTSFDNEISTYIKRCKSSTTLPIAMGFGIQTKKDVDFLKNKVDIAICCTQAVRTLTKNGVKEMGNFLTGLRN